MTLPTKTTYMSALKLCLGRMLLWLPEELAYPQEGLGPLQKAAITKGAIWIGPAPAIPSHWTSPGGCQVWPAPAPGEMWGHPHAGQKVCFTWMQAGPEASLWAQQRNMRELDTKNRVAYAGMSAKEKRNIRNKLTFSTEPTWCGLVIRGPPKWVTWNKGLGGGGLVDEMPKQGVQQLESIFCLSVLFLLTVTYRNSECGITRMQYQNCLFLCTHLGGGGYRHMKPWAVLKRMHILQEK